jgi:hypothetical protein
MTTVPLPPGRAGLRWGIYGRISSQQGVKTGEDASDTVSLDTQEERNRALIAALDPTGTIVESLVVREVWTGTELFTRPKLMGTLLPAIRRGEFDAIACYHPWRWTREPNHAGYLYTELDHNRVLLRFAEDDPGDDEKGRLLGYVQHWSGKQDHKTRTEQTHRARAKLVQLGQAWVGPKAPYGLRWRFTSVQRPDGQVVQKRSGWEIDPAQVGILRGMFARALAGASYHRIAVDLTADGVPSPTGRPGWSANTVKHLLENRVYIGEASGLRRLRDATDEYIGTRGKSVGRRKCRYKVQPPDAWVPLPEGYAPEVIDRATFEAVQARVAGRRRGGSEPLDPEVSLMRGGRARCGTCDRPLVVQSRRGQGGARPALVCHRGGASGRCPRAVSITAHQLDTAAKRLARAIYERPEILAEQAALHRQQDPTVADLAMVEQRLVDIKQRQASLLLVAQAITDPAAAAPLAAELDRLAEAERAALRDRAALIEQRAGWEARWQYLDAFTEVAASVRARLDAFDHAAWQEAIDALGLTATVWRAGSAERFAIKPCLEGIQTVALLRRLATGNPGEPRVGLERSSRRTGGRRRPGRSAGPAARCRRSRRPACRRCRTGRDRAARDSPGELERGSKSVSGSGPSASLPTDASA